MSKSYRTIAIFSMIWSMLGGAFGLLAIRGIQIAMGSGAVGPFPWVLAGVVIGVNLSLLVILSGLLRSANWAKAALVTVLIGLVLATIIGPKLAHWASDFWPNALILEAIWLGPWFAVLLQKKPELSN